jgi:hypothetical protein
MVFPLRARARAQVRLLIPEESLSRGIPTGLLSGGGSIEETRSRRSTMQRNLTSLDARYRAALLPLPPGRCSPCNSNSRIRGDEPIAERPEDRSEPSERFTFTSTITRRDRDRKDRPPSQRYARARSGAERRGAARRTTAGVAVRVVGERRLTEETAFNQL